MSIELNINSLDSISQSIPKLCICCGHIKLVKIISFPRSFLFCKPSIVHNERSHIRLYFLRYSRSYAYLVWVAHLSSLSYSYIIIFPNAVRYYFRNKLINEAIRWNTILCVFSVSFIGNLF